MWYESLGIISIGGQSGGPRDNGIGNIKIDLWYLLLKHCTSTHCAAVDHFALALRVGGQFADWSPERIHRVRRSRKERYIGCDIDIPLAVWQPQTTDQLKEYLAQKVRESIEVLVARLKKDKESIDAESLFREVDTAIKLFLAYRYTGYPEGPAA
ncbi:hypothetical protein M1B72_12655 [Geomonas paludis]|uniref:Uncharacterized protein n=1 Tax=Geomonas paludis TaxID=2740185 RepID=A0A6V8MW36_9BACT|nr:hypothetical protein [Geomonas paludis]UPU34300.1 hypothetical protein M1B72_12655 [Geomonas paludis]GFO64282.1 hypothetical protein GMPD_22010 [Geomonas paludis]